jgi:hypothetical protein
MVCVSCVYLFFFIFFFIMIRVSCFMVCFSWVFFFLMGEFSFWGDEFRVDFVWNF